MAGLPEVVVIKAREVLNNPENGLGVENINSDIQTIDINREKKYYVKTFGRSDYKFKFK